MFKKLAITLSLSSLLLISDKAVLAQTMGPQTQAEAAASAPSNYVSAPSNGASSTPGGMPAGGGGTASSPGGMASGASSALSGGGGGQQQFTQPGATPAAFPSVAGGAFNGNAGSRDPGYTYQKSNYLPPTSTALVDFNIVEVTAGGVLPSSTGDTNANHNYSGPGGSGGYNSVFSSVNQLAPSFASQFGLPTNGSSNWNFNYGLPGGIGGGSVNTTGMGSTNFNGLNNGMYGMSNGAEKSMGLGPNGQGF